MRDFGFNIYKALYELPERVKEKEKDDKKKKDDDKKGDEDKKRDDEKKKDDKKDSKDKKEEREKKSEDRKEDKKEEDSKKRDSKRDDRKSENNDDSEDDEDLEEDEGKDKRKDKDKKKKEKVKMFTKDRHLLLSFVYFDQTHCGYIFEKDIEDLLYTLGLNLSRAQVRKLVSKVITRDSLHYRKLTDKPKDDDFIVIDDSEKESNLEELAMGNKSLLPIFLEEQPNTKKQKLENKDEMARCDDGKLQLYFSFFCGHFNVNVNYLQFIFD